MIRLKDFMFELPGRYKGITKDTRLGSSRECRRSVCRIVLEKSISQVIAVCVYVELSGVPKGAGMV